MLVFLPLSKPAFFNQGEPWVWPGSCAKKAFTASNSPFN